MKLVTLLSLVVIGAASISQSEARKTPRDLSVFAGNYQGTMSASLMGSSFPGTAVINVRVPKNGRSATVTINGTAQVGGGINYPVSNTFHFFPGGNFTQEDLIYRFPSPSTSASGRYSARKKSVNFLAPWSFSASSGTTQGAMRVHLAGKRRQILTFDSFLIANGTTDYAFHFVVSKKVKPPKK